MPNVIVGSDGVENGSRNVRYQLSADGIRKTASLTYTVIGENQDTSEDSIVFGTEGIPQLGEINSGMVVIDVDANQAYPCLLYTSPSPRD